MTRLSLVLSVGTLCAAVACNARQPDPGYKMDLTVKDIMDSLADPGADVIWDSVATIIKPTGVEERAPRTDEEWKNVRRHAVMVMEATNLIQMPGRRVALPGQKADNPSVELDPETIQTLIDQDRQTFSNLAHGLYDAASAVLKAVDDKDIRQLTDAGEKIDIACENCHLKYWYPKGVPRPTATP